MPLLLIPILWIAMAAGRRIVRIILGASWRQSSILERCLLGLATGVTLMAYGLLAVGVNGRLDAQALGCLLVVLGVCGGGEHVAMIRDLLRLRSVRPSLFGILVGIGCAIFAVFALFECLTPPYPMEWDSLSYHLSDPSIFVSNHRIVYLPWESHSNFAFTMEMLYSIGVMFHSFALAKLFHFVMGAVAALGVYEIGRRRVDSTTGALAALLFVSIPLVFWEAGTAYVDLGATAFAVLAFLALVNAIELDSPRWLGLMALMLGCMLSVKATSIFTIVLYAGAAGIWLSGRGKGVAWGFKGLIAIGAAALVIGSPWYIKSWIVTGNPVYPFAYSIFGGRHWDTANSKLYTSNQVNFGVGHADPKARTHLGADILMAPWNLTMYTMPGHNAPPSSKPNPFNDIPTALAALSPLFLAALFVVALHRQTAPVAIRLALWISVLMLIPWAVSSQQERYLLPIYPLLCLASTYYMIQLTQEYRMAGRALEALFGVSVGFSMMIGSQVLRFDAPVVLGKESQATFLRSSFPAYTAFEFLNAQPEGSGVVLYGEPLGLYCRQKYMWGEPTHGKVIPYDSLATVNDLRSYLLRHGFHYILVNYTGAPLAPGLPGQPPTTWAQKVYGLTETQPVFDNVDQGAPIRIYRL